MTDLRRDFFLTRIVPMRGQEAPRVEAMFDEVTADARSHFGVEGIPAADVKIARSGSMRYANQEHTVEVPFAGSEPRRGRGRGAGAGISHQLTSSDYTYRLDASVELVEAHLVATVEVGKLKPVAVALDGHGRSTRHARAVGGSTTPTMAFIPPISTTATFSSPAWRSKVRLSSRCGAPRCSCIRITTCRMDDYGNLHIHLQATGAMTECLQ